MPAGRTSRHVSRAFAALCATAFALGASPAGATTPEPAPVAGPELASLVVDPATVDTSAAPAAVTVSARVADPDGVASVAVRLAGGEPVALSRIAGDPFDGTWLAVATVPAFTPHGPVPVTVESFDTAGTATAPVAGSALAVADTAPAAPARAVAEAAGEDTLRVEWAAPPANGGSPVEAYDVTAAPLDAGAATPPALSVLADATSASFAGLAPDTRYVVRVVARNAVGPGAAAVTDATTAVAAITVADAPTAVSAVPMDGALLVSWTVPASSGGTAVAWYEVAAAPRLPGVATPPVVTAAPGAPSAIVPGLANGVPYDVAVTAVNAVGPSLAGAATATPRTVPGAPPVTAAVPGNAAAAVHWSAPAADGGAPVTSYVVTASPSGAAVTVPGDTLSATVTGLPNGAAATFTVTAVNAAGPGHASEPSAAVLPRLPGRLVVTAQPAAAIRYGAVTAVGAALVSSWGTGLPGERVELYALRKGTATWQRVAYGTTGSTGRVTLRATLPATSSLRLRHPASAVAAPDVNARSVAVAPRVTASAPAIRLGMTVVARGAVAPAQPAGSAVRLQRYSAGAWRTVASGKMTTTTAFRVNWRPGAAGTFPLRVVKPADTDHATGVSARWSQVVAPETAADIAQDIRANARITLEMTHESGVYDRANAKQNAVDVADGRLARRSAYQNAPGGYTTLDRRMLGALRRMGALGRVTVSEIAGGSHARGSSHYYGRGLDISWVNGRHVAYGSGYGLAVDACRAFGAARVFHPAYDPFGGHAGHVHCDWD